MSFVQPGDGVAEPIVGEQLRVAALPARVDLHQDQLIHIGGAELPDEVVHGGERHVRAEEGQRVAEGRKHLVRERQVPGREQDVPVEAPVALRVGRAGRVADGLRVGGEESDDRVRVSGGRRRVHTRRVDRRGVRPHRASQDARLRGAIVGGAPRRLRVPGVAPDALGEERRALGLPQLDRASLLGVGLIAPASGPECRGERQPCVGVVEQRVGCRGDLDGGAARGRPRPCARRAGRAPRRAPRATRSMP